MSTLSTLHPDKTVLLVIDIQDKLLPAIFEKERVVQNTVLLARLAGILKLPVMVTTQYKRGLGDTVPEVAEVVAGVEPIDKVSFGCFGCDGFEQKLRSFAGRQQLLVMGIESHICVMQTVLSAVEGGFEVHLASDAVSSRTESNWKIGLDRMERAGAVISSAEMALYELLGRSDTPAFKQMLQYLKS